MIVTLKPLLFASSIVISVGVSSAHGADYLAMSGDQLYKRFCSSCHGASGRGDGPVSTWLRAEVPDLTLLKRRQGSAYSRERIEKIVDGRFVIGAHGTREMLIWGEDFSNVDVGSPDTQRVTDLIIKRLVDHVEALQRAPAKDAAK